MDVIEKLFSALPYLRRPYYQRDVALSESKAATAKLPEAEAELVQIGAAYANAKTELTKAREELDIITSALADTRKELSICKERPAPIDSRPARGRFKEPLWFLLASEDQRQDECVGEFRKYIAQMVAKERPSMEIGPSYNPILPKNEGYNVTILDHLSQSGLVKKYTPHGVDVSKIEPVDIVWKGISTVEATVHRKFQSIVAAHVIEHAPDCIQFLQYCSAALDINGAIYLIVPDKRYTFDFMQPITDIAKLLADHLNCRVSHSFESFYRLSACVLNAKRSDWDQSGIKDLTFAHGDPTCFRQYAEHNDTSTSYVDAHENYLTPVALAMIIDELRHLRELDLELAILTRPRGCEFLAVLRKAKDMEVSTDTFLERKMNAYRLLLLEEQERINSARLFLES